MTVDRILLRFIISNQDISSKTFICQGHALQAQYYSNLCSLFVFLSVCLVHPTSPDQCIFSLPLLQSGLYFTYRVLIGKKICSDLWINFLNIYKILIQTIYFLLLAQSVSFFTKQSLYMDKEYAMTLNYLLRSKGNVILELFEKS